MKLTELDLNRFIKNFGVFSLGWMISIIIFIALASQSTEVDLWMCLIIALCCNIVIDLAGQVLWVYGDKKPTFDMFSFGAYVAIRCILLYATITAVQLVFLGESLRDGMVFIALAALVHLYVPYLTFPLLCVRPQRFTT